MGTLRVIRPTKYIRSPHGYRFAYAVYDRRMPQHAGEKARWKFVRLHRATSYPDQPLLLELPAVTLVRPLAITLCRLIEFPTGIMIEHDIWRP